MADAFLGLSYPLYWGCTNIGDYFPEDSYSFIDIGTPNKAVCQVREILESNKYEENLKVIKKSKDLVLNTYNFFPHAVNIIENKVSVKNFLKKYKLNPEVKKKDISLTRLMRSSVMRDVYGGIIEVLP